MHVLIISEDHGAMPALRSEVADFGLDWKLHHAGEAVTALSLPLEQPIDVILTDLHMGAHYGPSLLRQLQAHHPESVRILMLEGDQEPDALQAMESAHRLLRKPLHTQALVDAIDSVGELRELLDNPALKQTVGRVGNLPPPPKLFLQINQMMQDPETGAADIATLLAQDPAMAAKVLRLCNSAYFTSGRAVADVRSAVTRLGLQTVRRLVLASEAFSGGQLPPGIDREALQDRALRTSRLAGQLLGNASAELAATAGLLAEVGMLLPGISIPTPEGGDLGDPEGPHYAEAGAYLLGLWGLPMPIVEAVANHLQPERVRSVGFWVTGALHVASSLVTGRAMDETYLRMNNQLERVPEWRRLAERIAAAA